MGEVFNQVYLQRERQMKTKDAQKLMVEQSYIPKWINENITWL